MENRLFLTIDSKGRQKFQEGKKKNSKPAFGTKEWATGNENLIKGCSHDCKYCYAKAMTIQHKRNTRDDWKNEIINQGKSRKCFRKHDGPINSFMTKQ
jgi:DNA repair photolyase